VRKTSARHIVPRAPHCGDCRLRQARDRIFAEYLFDPQAMAQLRTSKNEQTVEREAPAGRRNTD
jgi:hypothetical protein